MLVVALNETGSSSRASLEKQALNAENQAKVGGPKHGRMPTVFVASATYGSRAGTFQC